MSKSGHSKKDIHNKLQYKRIPKAELDDAIETIEKDMSSSIFWTTTEKGIRHKCTHIAKERLCGSVMHPVMGNGQSLSI